MTRFLAFATAIVVLAGCTSLSERPTSSRRGTQALAGLDIDCATAAVVGLRWQASGPDVAHYEILRDGAPLATTTATSFADTTVSESTHYSYLVSAVHRSDRPASPIASTEVNTAAASPTGDAPYCRSRYIESMSWDWSGGQTEPNGSDLWPVTWGKDGRVYTFFGDGGGFGGSNERGRTSFGIAVMTSPPPLTPDSVHNIYGGYNSMHQPALQGKGGSIIAVGSDFYALGGVWTEAELQQSGKTPPASGSPQRRQIAYSRGNAYSWQPSPWYFCSADGGRLAGSFCPMGFINFGPGNSGAPGGYVYLLGTDNSAAYWNGAGPQANVATYLARVPAQHVLQHEAYQYFAGRDTHGGPLWSDDQRQMRAIFVDRNGTRPGCGGTCNMTSVLQEAIYIRALGRYVGTAQGPHVGQTSFYDAPQPWGPWTTIAYNNIEAASGSGGWANLGIAGGESLGVHLIGAWASQDGLQMWATYSSDGTAPQGALFPPPGTLMDSFNLVRVRLNITPVGEP